MLHVPWKNTLIPTVAISIIAISTPLSALCATSATKTLWKEWYTYTVNGVVEGYYEEDAEIRVKEKQIAISQKWLEKSNAGTETFIGSVSTNDPQLSPVAFFCEKKGKEKAYNLDGRAKAGMLTITFKPITPAGSNIKKTVKLKKNTYLSNIAPMAIAKKANSDTPYQFTAVVEDAQDGKYEQRSGKALIQAKKKQVKGNTCRNYLVTFDEIDSEWWITQEGKLCEVYIPLTQSRLSLSSEAEAKASFGTK